MFSICQKNEIVILSLTTRGIMKKYSSETDRKIWRSKIIEQEKSGLNRTQWCLKNNTSADAFYYWKKKLFPKPVESKKNLLSFTEISHPPGLTLECQGLRFRIEKCDNPKNLALLLTKLLEEIC